MCLDHRSMCLDHGLPGGPAEGRIRRSFPAEVKTSDQETDLNLSESRSHLSFKRRDGVLQLLLQLCWHQTFDLLLVLSPYLCHLTGKLR